MTKPTWYWVYSNLGEMGFSIETERVEQIYICMCVLRKSHRYSYIYVYIHRWNLLEWLTGCDSASPTMAVY